MKKLLSALVAFALALSLAVPAFAANDDGKITITNATVGNQYTLYKIFDADPSVTDPTKVAYTITTSNQFFQYMFGDPTDPGNTFDNPYFVYNPANGSVVRKPGTEGQNSQIFDYLTTMVRSQTWTPVVSTVTAASETVVFDNLEYGYYLIDKGTGTAVTINNAAPTVEVIDKNQEPGSGFSKMVKDEDTGNWVTSSTAEIGENVDFKIEFEATNYDGDQQIKYYTVKDTKGGALWAAFDSVTVKINGVPLTRGYYFCTNTDTTVNTGDWEFFGTWTDAEKTDPSNAQWYLIHHGFDEFDIVIPWLEDHTFTYTHNPVVNSYELTFPTNAQSAYDSPVTVTIEYKASVEPSATIGPNAANNLWNQADLSWTSNTTSGPDDPGRTNLTVYALGVNKTDSDTDAFLPGAVFGLYRDVDCTDEVYVIPTNIEGVYILDDLTTINTGASRETSRKKYKDYLAAYLGADYETTNAQKNEVTTPKNGKIVVLGLEAGDYYLKEIEAPDGYNKLPSAVSVTVGTSNTPFPIYANHDASGKGTVIDASTEHTLGATEHTYLVSVADVENNAGMVLPSTGGEGTMKLITIGSLVAMAFAVLLITHKKMSVYHD